MLEVINPVVGPSPPGGELADRLRKHQLKGLILAQNERWRHGLGMQVAREM